MTPSTRRWPQTVAMLLASKNWTSLVTTLAQYFSSWVYWRFHPDWDFWTKAITCSAVAVFQTLRFFVALPSSCLASGVLVAGQTETLNQLKQHTRPFPCNNITSVRREPNFMYILSWKSADHLPGIRVGYFNTVRYESAWSLKRDIRKIRVGGLGLEQGIRTLHCMPRRNICHLDCIHSICCWSLVCSGTRRVSLGRWRQILGRVVLYARLGEISLIKSRLRRIFGICFSQADSLLWPDWRGKVSSKIPSIMIPSHHRHEYPESDHDVKSL